MDITYRVHPTRVEQLAAELSKLGARAHKLGVTIPSWSLSELKTDPPARDGGKPTHYYEVVVSDAPVKLAGWQFLATLDHTSELGVVLRGIPGETIPVQYRHAEPVCDHCGYKRNRKDTFIVRHDDGTIKQVGRQCMRDFLGIDPTNFAKAAQWALDIHDRVSNANTSISRDGYIELDELLAATATAIRLDGWTSRAVAQAYDKIPTSTTALNILFPPMMDADERRAFLRRYDIQSSDRELAQKALDWARTLRDRDDLNDYLHNLSVVAYIPYLNHKQTGLAVSIIAAYQRTLKDADPRAPKAAQKVSTHVGTVGQRRAFGRMTVRYVTFDSYAVSYNRTSITTFLVLEDESGNLFTWKASKELSLDKGDLIDVTAATVKSHDNYHGKQQTALTRVVFDVVTPAGA